MSDDQIRLPPERYSLEGTGAGFDILHEAKGSKPCRPENGQCHELEHLEPIARLE